MKNSGIFGNSIKMTNKKSHHEDSPYNHPNPVIDQTSNIHTLKNIHCLYHKEQLITNFCKSPDCLMPLCPECVKIHTEDHTKIGNYGVYDTIDDVWGSVWMEIDRIEDTYIKTKAKLQNLNHNNENGKAILLGRLHESKRKTIKFVEDFYRGIECEINEEHSNHTKDDLIGIEFTHSKIMERLKELEKFRKKLRGHKFLKYLIIFISSGIVPEHTTYTQEIDNYINQLNSKLTFLRDDLQPNFLFSFMNQYISLENKKENLPTSIDPRLHQPPPPFIKEKLPQSAYNYYPQDINPTQYSDFSPNQLYMMENPNINPNMNSNMKINPNMNPHMNAHMLPSHLNYENTPPQHHYINKGPPQNYEPSPFKQLAQNYEPQPPFSQNKHASQSVISPQKQRIFTSQNPALAEYNSPYPINQGIHNSGLHASASKDKLNPNAMNRFSQPEPLQDMYYGRPSGSQWDRI